MLGAWRGCLREGLGGLPQVVFADPCGSLRDHLACSVDDGYMKVLALGVNLLAPKKAFSAVIQVQR